MNNIKKHYHEFRCLGCSKLQFKGVLIESEVEVKCKRCGELNVFQGEPVSKHICLVGDCPARVQLEKRSINL